MENEKGGNQAEKVTEAAERICYSEGIVLEDVEPEDSGDGESEAATEEPPVGELGEEKFPGPRERAHFIQSHFKQDLSSAKEDSLDNRQCQESQHTFSFVNARRRMLQTFRNGKRGFRGG